MALIKTVTLGDKEYTALRFGPDCYEIPSRIMQMTRENGILVRDDDIYEFPWKGVTKDPEGQYILFPTCDLETFDSVFTTHRSIAPSLLRKIAIGLKAAKKGFHNLSTGGIFPLYRILVLDGKDIVLLPPDAGEVLATSRLREQADREVTFLTKPDTEAGYTLVMELSELLYAAAVGTIPYGKEAVRHAGYKEVPIALYRTGLEKETEDRIQALLNMPEKKQRKLSGNRKAEQNLEIFLEETDGLVWNLKDRTEEETEKALAASEQDPNFQSIYASTIKKAAWRDFWRKKGIIVLASVLILSLVGYLVGNFFYQKYKPPMTKDFTQVEIIEHVFECQNALNMGEISEGFKDDVTQYTEVLNLYVNKVTRQAYEGIDAFVRADEWIEGGMGPISKNSSIYGVVVNSIEETSENNYVAHTTWYTPYTYDDEEEVTETLDDGRVRCYVYSVDESFAFEWNKRGWWLCTETEIQDYELLEILEVETHEADPNMALVTLNQNSTFN